MTQKLREILQSVLLNIKADGLCNLDESCGCGLDDLAPCGNCNLDECEPAKWIKPEDGNPMVLEEFPEGYYSPLKKQAARIQELEGMLSIRTEELDIAHSVARSEKEMHEKELAAFARRIKELEEVLVEMVATNPCNIPTLCDVVHDELMCPALDGNCDFWKGCPQKNELREAARKQLQAEGKIGSGGGA